MAYLQCRAGLFIFSCLFQQSHASRVSVDFEEGMQGMNQNSSGHQRVARDSGWRVGAGSGAHFAYNHSSGAGGGGAGGLGSRTAGGEVARFLGDLTKTPAGALVQVDAAVGIVMEVMSVILSVVSILVTIWDFWAKWNSMRAVWVMLKAMRKEPEVLRSNYKKYKRLMSCMEQDIDEAVQSMKTVAVYFRLLRYAKRECARPDLHTNWIFDSHRCVRDAATERIRIMNNEICSPEYSDNLWAMIDHLEGADHTEHKLCRCLEGSHCGDAGWCWVEEKAPCKEHEANMFGWWSVSPCIKGKVDTEKAFDLKMSLCSVCNHGYFRSLEDIRDAFYVEKRYGDEYANVELAQRGARRELMEGIATLLRVKHGISAESLKVMSNVPPDSPIELQVYVELIKYDSLDTFDRRCEDFLSRLDIGERASNTVEDFFNETIIQGLESKAPGRFATAVMRASGDFWAWLNGIYARVKASIFKQNPELEKARTSKELVEVARDMAASGAPAGQGNAEEQLLINGVEKALEDKGEALLELSAEEQLEHELSARVEQELVLGMRKKGKCKNTAVSAMKDAEKSMQSGSSLAEVQGGSKSGRTLANVSLSMRGGIIDDLLHDVVWMPYVSLVRSFGLSSANIVDTLMSAWKLGYDYIYRAQATLELIALLESMNSLIFRAQAWVSIVTFFAWLVNNLAFAAFNHKMCPKISSWMELIDNIEPDSDEAAQLLAKPEKAGSHNQGVESCVKTAPEVAAEMEMQVKERSGVLEWLQLLRGVPKDSIAAAVEAPEGQLTKLLKQHDDIARLLADELSFEGESPVFCSAVNGRKSAAEQVLDTDWGELKKLDVRGDGTLVLECSRELRVKLPEQACKCPGVKHKRCTKE